MSTIPPNDAPASTYMQQADQQEVYLRDKLVVIIASSSPATSPRPRRPACGSPRTRITCWPSRT